MHCFPPAVHYILCVSHWEWRRRIWVLEERCPLRSGFCPTVQFLSHQAHIGLFMIATPLCCWNWRPNDSVLFFRCLDWNHRPVWFGFSFILALFHLQCVSWWGWKDAIQVPLLLTLCSKHCSDPMAIKNSIYTLPPPHRFSPSGSMVAVTERYRSKSESPGRMDEPKQPSSQVGRSRSLRVSVGLKVKEIVLWWSVSYFIFASNNVYDTRTFYFGKGFTCSQEHMLAMYNLKLILAVVWDFGQVPGKHKEFLLLFEGKNIHPYSGQATNSWGEIPFACRAGSALKH